MKLAAHLALVGVGLAAVIWALTLAAHPTIMCRDAVMGPGDVCANAQGTATQTYQQRLDTALSARPIVAGTGLAVAAFGAALAVQDARRRRA